MFVDPAKGDYRLKPGSPGIDAGVKIEAIGADLRGVERPQGKAYDIGAYEMKDDEAQAQRRRRLPRPQLRNLPAPGPGAENGP